MLKKLLVLAWLFLGGIPAAQSAFFSDDEARKKIVEQQAQISQLSSQLQALQGRLDEAQKGHVALETRIGGLEGQLRGQAMLELLNQIERLNADISQMKGQMEVVVHELEATQKRQRDLYTDLDGRLRKLEEAPAAKTPVAPVASDQEASTAAATAQGPAETPATTEPPAADIAAENRAYEAAYNTYKATKYADAISAFKQFAATYPNSKLVPNAYYWQGTAQFALKDYKAAITTQQKLLKQFPSHDKAADALYSIANSQIQLSDVDAAKQALRSLIGKYPASRIAETAKKRLSALEAMGAKK